ncbi:MAG: hypothetical protein IJW71_02640 [Clostridia bacterium]|nr:hypothetical protein [Clostridia bacterium]
MEKTVLVINGGGGVGKDTLCNMAARHFKVRNISSITPIKKLARIAGWNGEKTDAARKFLADLKALTVAFNDYPTNWIVEEFKRFQSGRDEILFVHIREPEEIAKFVSATGGVAKTLLVRGGKRMEARRRDGYGNAADDGVENYAYDYYYVNEKPLYAAEKDFVRFLREQILK